jgi:multiple sugar transport system substrate-binding protein
MKQITRRQLLKGAALAGIGALGGQALAGCAPVAPAPAAPQGAAQEAAPTTAPAAAEKATVRWNTWSDGAWLALEQKIVEAYNKQSQVAQLALETAPWGQYWDKLQVSLAAGTAADLVWMSGAMFLNLAEKGGLLDLTDLIKATSFPFDDYYTQPDIFSWQGKIYGLPWSMGVQALYVNKTAFKEAGVALPPEKWDDPKWTWNEFLETAKAMTKGTERYGVQSSNGTEFYWGNFVWSNGGDILNKEQTHTTLDTPEATEALRFAVDLIHKEKVSPAPGDTAVFQAGAPRPFALGKVAMDIGNNAYIPDYVAQIKDFEWGIYPLPKAPKEGAKPAPSYNGNPTCMASKTKVRDQAFDAMSFLSGKEGMGMVAAGKLTIPALKAAASTDPYITPPPTGMLNFAEGFPFAQDLRFNKHWLEWVTAYEGALDRAFTGEAPVEEAIKQAVAEGDKALNQ